MIWLLVFSICVGMLLGPVDLLVFISLITDNTSFSEAGFMKKYRSLEIIFVTGVSVDNLTFYIASNCHKEVVKCFSLNFGIRFSLIVYVYGSDLFMRVYVLKALRQLVWRLLLRWKNVLDWKKCPISMLSEIFNPYKHVLVAIFRK